MGSYVETPLVSFVLPALNEAQALPYTLSSIPGAQLDRRRHGYEIVVVDNGSDDGSGGIARRLGARVIEEPIPSYGAALMTGIAGAHGKLVITGDADGTYPFHDSLFLLDYYRAYGLDFLNTSRRRCNPGARSLTSRVGNDLFVSLSRRVYGKDVPFEDMLSGMWVFDRVKMLRLLQDERVPTAINAFSNHIKLLAYSGGLRCDEVSIDYEKRKGGTSKIKVVRDGIRKLFYTCMYKKYMDDLGEDIVV